MTNIWEFLLQTLSVSLTAGLIWIIKAIFEDKLSPRWQYGVWSILALRILLPVQSTRYILPKLALLVETLKGTAERALNSALTAVYTPIQPNHVVPRLAEKPVSVTDWLFAVYAAGVLLFLLRYLIAHLRLRNLLRKGLPASASLQQRIDALCGKYQLKPCRTVVIAGLESAFVCGVFRPVLAVPSEEIDEKILLHELLHLKYKDIPQGIFWSILRALHWCNPLMHMFFDRIGNDMESLCDQRVLERLEGEERRDYGVILLSMANRRYARTPGTSSISNGGKNIARRIAAIVRFKKYPKGMALVSICIMVLMLFPAITGQAASFGKEYYTPDTAAELTQSMAAARLNRCSTLAGALDTYAKGLLTGNALYIATASPLSSHEALETEMRSKESGAVFYLGTVGLLEDVNTNSGYQIIDLDRQEDGSYRANLVFARYPAESGTLLVPVRVFQQDGWVVEETGEQLRTEHEYDGISVNFDAGTPRRFTATGKSGTITILRRVYCDISNEDGGMSIFEGFSDTFMPDAVFGNIMIEFESRYQSVGKPEDTVALQVIALEEPEEIKDFPETDLSPNSSGHSGEDHWICEKIHSDWDGFVRTGGGHGYGGYDAEELPSTKAYRAQILWDDKVVEELTLKEVQP